MTPLRNRLAPVLCLLGGLALAAAPLARAYVLATNQFAFDPLYGQPLLGWPKGTVASPNDVRMQLHLEVGPPAFPSASLQDGSTSWNQVIQAAMADWNQHLSTLQLTGVTPATDSIPTQSSENNHNDIFWSSTVYGESYDEAGSGSGIDTLALTVTWYDDTDTTTETDVLFNNSSSLNWNSYRGDLQGGVTDLRRVALHELGLVLGLDDPDRATPPQTVAAIMNSTLSNTDDLTADDIAGGQYLYGSGPALTTQPASQTVIVGSAVTLSVTPAGSGPFTYQWQKNGADISGAVSPSLALGSVQMTDAGDYAVVVTDADGSTTSGTAVLTVTATPPAAPVITLQPVSQTSVAGGSSVVFSVAATGVPAPTFQWSLNGLPISGATDPVYFLSGAGAGNAGTYTCAATNSVSSATSSPATLTLGSASTHGYLINISARADVGTGNNILIGGFAVGGSGAKQLLVRGAGPALTAPLGGSGELVTPELVLLDNNGAIVASDLGWNNSPVPGPSTASESPTTASVTTMNQVGASSYQQGSADTAMVVTAPVGNNTAEVSGVGGTRGIALVEIYDADTGTPAAHLINLSARADVGTGNNILIGGFAISGAASETVLIRAVGPGLVDSDPQDFSLSAVLNQPVLTLLNSSGTVIYTNTVWGGDATIAGVANAVGAFSLNPGHQDSALLVTLPAGDYTAEISGLNGGTGIALCEIYEVQ